MRVLQKCFEMGIHTPSFAIPYPTPKSFPCTILPSQEKFKGNSLMVQKKTKEVEKEFELLAKRTSCVLEKEVQDHQQKKKSDGGDAFLILLACGLP